MMYWMGIYTFFLLGFGFLIGRHTEKQKNDLLKQIAERPITWKNENKPFIPAAEGETMKFEDANTVDKPVYNPSYGDPTTINWIDNDYAKRQKGEE